MPKPLIISILAENQLLFDQCKNRLFFLKDTEANFVFCDSRNENRFQIISKYPSSPILFLDSDCEIDQNTASYIQINLNQLKLNTILVGYYVNPANSLYLQRAHNFIANTWIEFSFLKNQKSRFFLGGAFLVYTDIDFKALENEKEKFQFWGAEDKLLAKHLNEYGCQFIYCSWFRVIHHTSHTLKHFIKRAWLHGENDVLFLNENFKIFSLNEILFLIQSFQKLNLLLTPAILLHLLIQKFAKIFRWLLRKSSIKKLR